jgi:putative PIN family toxin of toxin-antitoxin system
LRVVLDTSIVIAAIRSSAGAAAEIVRLAFLRRMTVLMDYKLACEYREVAVRPEHLRASEKTQREIELVLDALEAVAEPVLIWAKIRPLSQDPSDDMVLDIAINGLADAIVTHNVRHFRAAASRLRIPVLRPIELLGRIQEER